MRFISINQTPRKVSQELLISSELGTYFFLSFALLMKDF